MRRYNGYEREKATWGQYRRRTEWENICLYMPTINALAQSLILALTLDLFVTPDSWLTPCPTLSNSCDS